LRRSSLAAVWSPRHLQGKFNTVPPLRGGTFSPSFFDFLASHICYY
jgi:hypothetical protein